MAERSQFWTTGTTGDGTTSITQAQTTEWFRDIITPRSGGTSAPNTTQGVLRGLMNDLEVTGTTSPVSVAAGGACVEGFYYKSDSAVNVTVPTPTINTRIDRIVLRAVHGTTRTVRITRIAGAEGGGAPALTQSAGATWDIPLAQLSVTTGGVITVTDQRTYAQFATNHVKRDGDDMTGTLTLRATPGVTIESTAPAIRLTDTNASVNEKVWDLQNVGNRLELNARDDALGTPTSAITISRSGLNANIVNVISNALHHNGSTVWTSANDGAGSGLDADTLDGLNSTQLARLAAASNFTTAPTISGNTVWHAGNDGAGSGLDADLLDGLQASSFARLAATSNFTTAPTINGGTVWHSLNDGAGSGLNADLVQSVLIQPLTRRGGSSTNWTATGTTNYNPTVIRFQAGSVELLVTSSAVLYTAAVTFPTAYPSGVTPLVFAQVSKASAFYGANAVSITNTGFTMELHLASAPLAGDIVPVYWLAIAG